MPKLTRLWPAPTALSLGACTPAGRVVARWTFERRVARVLGMDARLVRELLASARSRRRERYVVRSAAFLLATTPLSPRVLPFALRSRAIQSFVWWLLAWHRDNPRLALAYAGDLRSFSEHLCPGPIP